MTNDKKHIKELDAELDKRFDDLLSSAADSDFDFLSKEHTKRVSKAKKRSMKKSLKHIGFGGSISIFFYLIYKGIKSGLVKFYASKVIFFTVVSTVVAVPPVTYVAVKMYAKKQNKQVEIKKEVKKETVQKETKKTVNVVKKPRYRFAFKSITIKAPKLDSKETRTIRNIFTSRLQTTKVKDYVVIVNISYIKEESQYMPEVNVYQVTFNNNLKVIYTKSTSVNTIQDVYAFCKKESVTLYSTYVK